VQSHAFADARARRRGGFHGANGWLGLRRFAVRGLENVRAGFLLMALTHNLLKLFRLEPKLAASA
jgi:hypothetical protein